MENAFLVLLADRNVRRHGGCCTLINAHRHLAGITQVRCFGQPVPQTHPHLLSEDDVTPGVTQSHYKTRRHRLMKAILSKVRQRNLTSDTHIIVIPSATVQYMTHDIPYVFRQHTDFLYLCGFQEPDSVLILTGHKNSLPSHTATLFVRPKDPHKELWEGERSGKKGAVELTGVDNAKSIATLPAYLDSQLKQSSRATVWYSYTKPAHPRFHEEHFSGIFNNFKTVSLENVKSILHEIRLIKTEEEVELLQKSNDIASAAFRDVMTFSHPGVHEAHLWAKMDFECRMRGAQNLAYPPVIAGGNRANTIHYIKNDQVVQDGSLVLMDAGCEYHGYASDITRTWPVSGKFSEPQRELYEALLEVQELCVSLCSLHDMTLNKIFEEMLSLLAESMQRIGLVPSALSGTELYKAARELCPHHVGHYLGMDVHDTDTVSRMRQLQSGMVLTIEPGVYIPKTKTNVPQWFKGIGIRIEDNVLITQDGYRNLTNCPKRIEDIERLFAVKQ